MATLLAHIDVKPGREAAFEAIARALHARSIVEQDILRYEYWRGQEPRRYYCLLAFADYRAFMVHQTSEYHEAAVGPLGDAIAHMRLEWLDPVPGAAPLPTTREQALAADAIPLARRYAEAIPLVVRDWWRDLRSG